jgi:lactoylglutathione lyase
VKFAKTILYVEDVPATLAFFEKAFGIPNRFFEEQGYGELDTGDTIIAVASFEAAGYHLPDGYTAGPAIPEAVSVELGFLSDTVEADFDRAVAAGAQPLQRPETKPWGQTVSYLRTPDGTIIDLSSPVAWKNES